ncbi:MAG: hypothetical protein ACT4QE_07445 [Anaerolineales bacterium]
MNFGSRALDDLFWRDEILQIAYWFRGEGFGEALTAPDLRRFLPAEAPDLTPHLARMATEGLLESVGPGRYRLTDLGHKEGARRFADAFEGLNKPAHGECSADCDCHSTGNTANCPSKTHAHAHAH